MSPFLGTLAVTSFTVTKANTYYHTPRNTRQRLWVCHSVGRTGLPLPLTAGQEPLTAGQEPRL